MVVGIGRVGGRGAWPEDSLQQNLQFIYTLLLILAKATYSWCFIHSLFLCKNLNAACADFSRFVKNFLCLLFSKAGLKRLLNTREPFNPIQDGPFWGRSRMGGGAKRLPSLKSVTHILQRWTWHSYTLPKEDKKIYESRDTPLEFCWHQHFFIGNQQVFLYQKIQI